MKTGLGLPKAGCVFVAEVNENWGPDAPVDDPNIMGELVEATGGVDAPKANPEVDEVDELKEVPKGDLLGCQLESPNRVELVPLLELPELASKEEAGVLCPVVPELKIFVAGLEEGNDELPEEKAVFPVNPNNEDDVDEPNATD